jgi:hypothetical protein
MNLSASNLRSNVATWAVAPGQVPAVAAALLQALPVEPFDPAFQGQRLETTYFDTAAFDLRQARHRGARYLTLRLRCYHTARGEEAYALSAKTENTKFRVEVAPDTAAFLLAAPSLAALESLLPGDLLARLLDLAEDRPLLPVVRVRATRFGVEDAADRLTLDVDVSTDTGKVLSTAVLEFKSIRADPAVPTSVLVLGLRPMKLSKFLWSTLWR